MMASNLAIFLYCGTAASIDRSSIGRHRAMKRGTLLLVFICLHGALTLQSCSSRRIVMFGCGALLAPKRLQAYDALPVTTAPDPAELARRRKAREAKAAVKNAEAAPLLQRISASRDATEYDAAMAQFTLWIIGTGPPIASDGAAWGSTFEGPLPEGFRTRYAVATCKDTLDSLPRFRQEAGQYVSGLGTCEKTRDTSFCLSAGPLAESAYKAMLVELKKRVPRQYDTPYGPVAF